MNTDNILGCILAEVFREASKKMLYLMVGVCIAILIVHRVYVGNWGF